MPNWLDPRLCQVAKLRQISIKTARDWRDSENHKWTKALAEIEKLPRPKDDGFWGNLDFELDEKTLKAEILSLESLEI